MGTIAGIAAIAAYLAAVVMLVLSGLGFWHGRRTPPAEEAFAAQAAPRAPATVG
jgi:hypothetical protein